MSIVALFAVGIAVLISVYFCILSFTAKPPKAGLVDNRLRRCSGKPNCVCSDFDDKFTIQPIKQTASSSADDVVRVIESLGGNVEERADGWIWATFTSRLFRFVDDLELRWDQGNGVWQVRSESRSGTSDLGVNRKRVELLRERL